MSKNAGTSDHNFISREVGNWISCGLSRKKPQVSKK